MKKIVLFSLLATSLLAAPTVQAQMRHGQGWGSRGAMVQGRGGWFGNHGYQHQAQRPEFRNQRFDHRGFWGGNRNNYRSARNWGWGRGLHRGFAQNQQPRGWAHNNSRGPYQGWGYGNYRQPYRPATYGPRPGFDRSPQAAYGNGGRNYHNYDGSASHYGSSTGAYNGNGSTSTNSGTLGTITSTSTGTTGSGGWTHSYGTTSGRGWSGHTNTRVSSGQTTEGSTPATTSD
jgi:hypothetical protein